MFDCEFVHIGMDEVFDFALCPRCRKRISDGESMESLFLKHIIHTHHLLAAAGKTMMMWDDFFELLDIVDKIPRDIVLCNWNYGY